MTTTTTPGPTTTQERIKELEQRLDTGWNKLRDLELTGKWNEAMYIYWLGLEKTYMQLCKASVLFTE